MKKDRAKYYGPFTSSSAVKNTIDLINKLYGLRTCNRTLPRDVGLERPCLNYHMKRCCGPCTGCISSQLYRERIDKALEFLNGNYGLIMDDLSEKMMAASEAMDYESAAHYRDLLNSVKMVAQKQKMTDSAMEDKDIVAMASDESDAVVQIFFIRDGRLIGREHFYKG